MEMKKMSKWMLAAMTASTIALTGCGSDNDENAAAAEGDDITIRVAWWGNQDRHEKTLEAIDLFEELHPNITIEAEFSGWDGYWDRLNTQAAGNSVPDVVQMDFTRLNEYSQNDLIIDLAPFIEDGTINLDNVDDVYLEDTRDGDKVLGISLGANANALIYNRTLLEELGFEFNPGDTYEDLKDLMLEAREVLEAQGESFYGFDFGGQAYDMFLTFARQHGQSLFNEDGTGLGVDEQTLINYFAWIQDMINAGASPTPEVAMSYLDGAQEMLHDRTALFRMASSNHVIGFSEGTNDELGVAVLPALEGGQDGNWVRAGMSFAISSHSQEQEAAAMFIDFFTNSIEANEILQADRGVPISSEVREHMASIVTGPVKETFDFLDVVVNYTSPVDPLPPAAENEVRVAFGRTVEPITHNIMTPEDAAQQFIEEAARILN